MVLGPDRVPSGPALSSGYGWSPCRCAGRRAPVTVCCVAAHTRRCSSQAGFPASRSRKSANVRWGSWVRVASPCARRAGTRRGRRARFGSRSIPRTNRARGARARRPVPPSSGTQRACRFRTPSLHRTSARARSHTWHCAAPLVQEETDVSSASTQPSRSSPAASVLRQE